MSFEESEEIFEELEETFDEVSEKEYLEELIADSEARLQELSDEEMEDVEGGASVIRGPITRNLVANAYTPIYRVMLTNCPGSVTKFIKGTNVKKATKSGNTYIVYRQRLGRCTFTVVSKRFGQEYHNKFTVNFK